MSYAGKHRYLTYLSLILSVISAVFALLPFVFIFFIVKEIIEVSPNYSDAVSVVRNGWMAVLFALISIFIYVSALMCSHKSAFRIAGNLRKTLMSHISKLPLGFIGEMGSGKIHRIVNDSNSITAVHVLPQVKDGRSSDGQFMFNTGLLPLKSGAVATRYDDVDYYSIAKALKRRNYTAVNMTVDGNNYWNQAEISVAYGYDQNIDRLGGGTSVTDSVLMERAIEKIKVQKTPFFYQLITGTSHKPYNEPYRKTKLSGATEFPEEVRNYMEVIHYTDRCIGAFVDSLRSNGLYDNTVIAIASDHNQLLSPCGVPGYNDTEAAFIVANADVKYTHTSVMGQIDIYPTLLDVMNCNDYAWKGLGYSILRTPVGSAAGWNGTVYGNEGDSLASRQIEAWDISEKIITKGYFSIK